MSPSSFVLCNTPKFSIFIYHSWKRSHFPGFRQAHRISGLSQIKKLNKTLGWDRFGAKSNFWGPWVLSHMPENYLGRSIAENFSKIRHWAFFQGRTDTRTHRHTFFYHHWEIKNNFCMSVRGGGGGELARFASWRIKKNSQKLNIVKKMLTR